MSSDNLLNKLRQKNRQRANVTERKDTLLTTSSLTDDSAIIKDNIQKQKEENLTPLNNQMKVEESHSDTLKNQEENQQSKLDNLTEKSNLKKIDNLTEKSNLTTIDNLTEKSNLKIIDNLTEESNLTTIDNLTEESNLTTIDNLTEESNLTTIDNLTEESNLTTIDNFNNVNITEINNNQNNQKMLEGLKNKLAEFPNTRRRSGIVLEEEIDSELTTYCQKNGITVETFLEAAWLIVSEKESILKKISKEAKNRYIQRKEAGQLRRLITTLEKQL